MQSDAIAVHALLQNSVQEAMGELPPETVIALQTCCTILYQCFRPNVRALPDFYQQNYGKFTAEMTAAMEERFPRLRYRQVNQHTSADALFHDPTTRNVTFYARPRFNIEFSFVQTLEQLGVTGETTDGIVSILLHLAHDPALFESYEGEFNVVCPQKIGNGYELRWKGNGALPDVAAVAEAIPSSIKRLNFKASRYFDTCPIFNHLVRLEHLYIEFPEADGFNRWAMYLPESLRTLRVWSYVMGGLSLKPPAFGILTGEL